MKAGDITKIKKGKWAELGGKLVTRIVEDADKGISQDGDGDKFPPYRSKKYKELKKAGKLVKGVGISRQVNPPDLRLTGEMLNSLKVQKATTESVEVNYRSGLKVIGHSKKRGNKPKRNIYGLNKKNEQFVRDFIEEEIDERIIKFYKKRIIFDIKA